METAAVLAELEAERTKAAGKNAIIQSLQAQLTLASHAQAASRSALPIAGVETIHED
jgi:hypothetical protein